MSEEISAMARKPTSANASDATREDTPYGGSSAPIVRPSVCLYADILGFSRMVCDCKDVAQSQALLGTLLTALGEQKQMTMPSAYDGFQTMQSAVFSDSIVLGIPFRDSHAYGEPELGDCVSMAADFQLRLALKGFFIRGAITLGELFVGPDTAFGKALVEAAQLEREAKMPRVILSEAVSQLIRHHLTFYSNPASSPQGRNLLYDDDGRMFLNWLHGVDYTGNGPDWDLLATHSQIIAERRDQFQSEPEIRAKYDWLADYHNHYCGGPFFVSEEWPGPPGGTADSLMIPNTSASPTPRFRPIADGDPHDMSLKSRP